MRYERLSNPYCHIIMMQKEKEDYFIYFPILACTLIMLSIALIRRRCFNRLLTLTGLRNATPHKIPRHCAQFLSVLIIGQGTVSKVYLRRHWLAETQAWTSESLSGFEPHTGRLPHPPDWPSEPETPLHLSSSTVGEEEEVRNAYHEATADFIWCHGVATHLL